MLFNICRYTYWLSVKIITSVPLNKKLNVNIWNWNEAKKQISFTQTTLLVGVSDTSGVLQGIAKSVEMKEKGTSKFYASRKLCVSWTQSTITHIVITIKHSINSS